MWGHSAQGGDTEVVTAGLAEEHKERKVLGGAELSCQVSVTEPLQSPNCDPQSSAELLECDTFDLQRLGICGGRQSVCSAAWG